MKDKGTMASRTETMGDRIRASREERQMTQKDVADILGISRAAIAQWENNTTSPSIDTMAHVAKVLNESPQWLAFGISMEPTVIYREPEGSAAISEATFGNTSADIIKGRMWNVPADYLRTELNCSTTDGLLIYRVESPNMAPTYEYGDKVIIDTNAKRPSSGVFLIWDGIGPSLNQLSLTPNGKGGMNVKVVSTADGESYEVPVDKIKIIGRVRGLLKNV